MRLGCAAVQSLSRVLKQFGALSGIMRLTVSKFVSNSGDQFMHFRSMAVAAGLLLGLQSHAHAGTVTFSPSVLDFGQIVLGDNPKTLSVSLQYTLGSFGPDQIRGIYFTDGLYAKVKSNTCDFTSSNCSFDVSFTAPYEGDVYDTIGVSLYASDPRDGDRFDFAYGSVDVIASVSASPVLSPVPLPASAPMFGAALLALAGLGYAANRKKAAAAT